MRKDVGQVTKIILSLTLILVLVTVTGCGGGGGGKKGNSSSPGSTNYPGGNNGVRQNDPSGNGSGNNSSEPWKTLGKAGFSNGAVVNYFRILLDKNDIPYVLFEQDPGLSGQKPTLMKYYNGTWSVVGKEYFTDTDSISGGIDFTLDKNGTPWVVYSANNGFTIKVMKYDSSSNSWKTIGTTSYKGASDSCSIAVDSKGVLFLASINSSSAELNFLSTPVPLLGFHGRVC